jgi:hypothetical protein
MGLNKLNHIYSTEPLTVESLLANNDATVLDSLNVFGNVLLDGSLGLANQVLKVNSSASGVEWATLDALPSQSSNSGKYLTTDGTTASWGTLNLSLYATLANPSFTGTVNSAGNVISHTDVSTPTFSSNNYTIQASDDGKVLMLDNSTTAATIKVPTDLTYNFTVGTQITIIQKGPITGQITVDAVTPLTTTINATPGKKLRARWSSATLLKTASNTWVLMGDLTV